MERLSTMIEGERKKAIEEPENTHVEVETHKSISPSRVVAGDTHAPASFFASKTSVQPRCACCSEVQLNDDSTLSTKNELGDQPNKSVHLRSCRKRLPSGRGKGTRQMKFCQRIIKQLFWKKNRSFAWPFLEAGKESKLRDLHDWHSEPMNLDAIRRKIEAGKYASAEEVKEDTNLVYENCLKSYSPSDPMYRRGKRLQAYFEEMWKKMPGDKIAKTKRQKLCIAGAKKRDRESAGVGSALANKPNSLFLQRDLSADAQIEELRFGLEAEQIKLHERLDKLRACWKQIFELRTRRMQARAKREPIPVLTATHISSLESLLTAPIAFSPSSSAGSSPVVFPMSASVLSRTQAVAVVALPEGSVSSNKDGMHLLASQRQESQNESDDVQNGNLSHDDQHLELQAVSDQEKLQLLRDLYRLPQDKALQLLMIIISNEGTVLQSGCNTFEFDFEALKPTTLREMQAFATAHLCTELSKVPSGRIADGHRQSAQEQKSIKSTTPAKKERVNSVSKKRAQLKNRKYRWASASPPAARRYSLITAPNEEDERRIVSRSYVHLGAKPLLTAPPELSHNSSYCILDQLIPLKHDDMGREANAKNSSAYDVEAENSQNHGSSSSQNRIANRAAIRPTERIAKGENKELLKAQVRRRNDELEEGECASDSGSEITNSIDLQQRQHQSELIRRREQERRLREAMASAEVVTSQMDVMLSFEARH